MGAWIIMPAEPLLSVAVKLLEANVPTPSE